MSWYYETLARGDYRRKDCMGDNDRALHDAVNRHTRIGTTPITTNTEKELETHDDGNPHCICDSCHDDRSKEVHEMMLQYDKR